MSLLMSDHNHVDLYYLFIPDALIDLYYLFIPDITIR